MTLNFTPAATPGEKQNADEIRRTATQISQVTQLDVTKFNPQNSPAGSEGSENQGSTPVALKKIEYRNKGEILKYPSNLDQNQDCIEFSVYEYNDPRSIASAGLIIPGVGGSKDPYKKFSDAGTVFLPITKINDNNTVDWIEERLNEIQRVAANASIFLQGGSAVNKEAVQSNNDAFDQFGKFITGSPAGNLFRTYFAGQAVQANNLLTRSTGAILNPNLELLFNGPQLRQFSFSFDMVAREGKSKNGNENEAEIIKKIIYFFKAYMAVRDNIGDLGQIGDENQSIGVFLNSPYVFKIRYLKGHSSSLKEDINSLKEHKSIGKIKMCALQSCSVDYTPMGTYMTFDDDDATMVMYRITLQFKELTPIYASDYKDHQIGY